MLLDRIAGFARDYPRNFEPQETQVTLFTGSRHPSQKKKKKRRPPPQDCFKTNFDRALFNESDEASLGIVIRNSEGQVMATLLEKKKPPSVVTLDLLAARRAAAFVSKTGFQQSCFESDTEIVTKSL